MPAFRFNTAFKIARDVRAFVNIEGGVTRGLVPEANSKAHARESEGADEQVAKLRSRLKDKNRKIVELSRQLSAVDGSAKGSQGTTIPNPGDGEVGTLPDFVIIGGKKCGTTFLYHLLCQNPYVAPAANKEVHYFDGRFRKGLDWYRSQFPPPEEKEGRRVITGEASPYYLYHPHAAWRAAETIPHAKLIVLLRDPVDRAFSDYHDKVRQGNEPLSFEEAIDAEEDRLRGEKEKMLAEEHYKGRNYRAFSYRSRGIYVDQLREWHKFFGRDQILVLKSEDMFDNTPDTLKKVLDFLHVPNLQPNVPPVSETQNEGQYVPMELATRELLQDSFEPHNRRLYEYLGTDFGW